MKLQFVLTDDQGFTYQGEVDLRRVEVGEPSPHPSETPSSTGPDFKLPIRFFMKRYGAGMSGAKRFGLLVARMTGGNDAATVQRAEVEKLWNRMKPLMGGSFNGAYSNRAKENGWVDSPKAGQYALLPGWREILTDEGRTA